MKGLTVRLDIRFSPALARWGTAALLVCASAVDIASESVTLTTYYPAPSGIYTKLITTQNDFLARDGGNDAPGNANQTWVDVGTTASGASNPLAVPPGGNYKMSIMGGNVGIGTTNPNTTLHLAGGGAQIDGMAADPIAAGQSGIWTLTGSGLVFKSGVTNVMYVKSNGNIGIGLTDPTNPLGALDVNGNVSITGTCAVGPTDYVGGATIPCAPNTYATWFLGVYTYYQTGSEGTTDRSGQMYCCPCPGGSCSPTM